MQTPYLIIGCVIVAWAVLVALSKFPSAATHHNDADDAAGKPKGNLFKHGHFLLGVVAQFFYVGAQVGVWSYTIRYAQAEIGITDKAAADYVFAALVVFAIGRFVGTGLLRILPANRVLTLFALANIVLTAIAATVGGKTGLYCMVGSSFFMSIMFPTIFATSLRGLGPLTKLGASLLVMSIIGGAVLTAVMGKVSDMSHIRTAIFVPVACFVVIALYSLMTGKDDGKSAVLPSAGH